MFGGLFWLGDLDLDLSLTLVTRVLILMLCSLQDAASRQEILGCGRRGESQAVPHDSGRRAVNLYFPTLLLFCRQIIAAALITLDGRSLKYKKYLIQFSLFKAGLYWEKSQHGPKLRDAALNQSHAQKPSPFRRAWDQCIGICIKNIYEKINLNSS